MSVTIDSDAGALEESRLPYIDLYGVVDGVLNPDGITSVTTSSGDSLLMESGDAILMETGDTLLME